MMPTLLVGDHIFVDKMVYRTRKAERGEVAVFQFPENPQYHFVKRVIAGPNDTLEIRGGHPWINGWEVPHCKVGSAELGGVPETRILGCAEVIWLSVSGERMDGARIGSSLAEPTLPASLKHLEPALDRCLATRPPREATVPPQR